MKKKNTREIYLKKIMEKNLIPVNAHNLVM